MEFSEKVKEEARRKAHYRCCICQEIKPLNIHHIEPKGKDGPNTLDNAVALCPNCHDLYGGDAKKKKWIKKRRDWFYEHCEQSYGHENNEKIEQIHKIVADSKTSNDAKFAQLGDFMRDLAVKVGDLSAQMKSAPGRTPATLYQLQTLTGAINVGTATMTQLRSLSDEVSISDDISMRLNTVRTKDWPPTEIKQNSKDDKKT